MIEIKMKLRGTKPLLMANAAHMLLKREPKVHIRGIQTRDLKAECEASAYRTKDGFLKVTDTMLLASLREGSKKRHRGAAKIIDAGMNIRPEELVIFWKGKPVKDYEPDLRTAVNHSGARTIRVVVMRPMIRNWEIEAELSYNPAYGVPLKDLRAIADDAGMYEGIGSYRPRFGTYEIMQWKESET